MTFGLAFALGFCACLACVAVGFVVVHLYQLDRTIDRTDEILKRLRQPTWKTRPTDEQREVS